jgi:co-chaperonin GroES (HSP10)
MQEMTKDNKEFENNKMTDRNKKTIRKLNPLGFRVLVQIEKDSNVTDAGLYLPEGSKESMQQSLLARVIEVASAVDHETDHETNVSGVPLDALVLIPKGAGTKVPWDESLRIVETKEILALVNEIAIT